jgi:anti-sigma regulatory factor (Ser/Thr protein kinase)
MLYPVVQQFSFQNARLSVMTSLREIIEFINGNLSRCGGRHNRHFDIEMVIIELLTNAIKHTGDTEISVNISISNEHLTIEKSDYGNPFNPNGFLSRLTNTGSKVQISRDDLYSIYALIETDNQARFICEENNTALSFTDIIEHFGLLIITRSAEEFTYRYNPATGLNTFRVIMHLNDD